uniref:Potassium channel tetramerisation-type BTB domain-containing protein n=1 Tax=Lynx canadensis TaxID=61383 RepID=A0A667HMS2_LYNCA
MLKAMFSGRMEVLTDKEGWILIDRCGKHFGTILNYLRDDTIILPQNRQEIKELMAEAKYYLIQGLVNMCQTASAGQEGLLPARVQHPHHHIPERGREAHRILHKVLAPLRAAGRGGWDPGLPSRSPPSQPVVKLLYNRSNNKYSYTSNSDDHLLKTSSCLTSSPCRFNGRVLFLKDVIGDEIAAGPSMARVASWQRCAAPPSCTPRRRNRPRWSSQRPRIYEETLNVLLYETPRVPDNSYGGPPAVAAARLPPVKMRRPLNCGTVSAVSTSSATAPTMTGSSATSLPIVTDETLRESGHRTPCPPPVEPCPTGHPTLLLAGFLSQHPEACQEVRGPEQERDHLPLPCSLNTSR